LCDFIKRQKPNFSATSKTKSIRIPPEESLRFFTGLQAVATPMALF
jgi:hypothetical protein